MYKARVLCLIIILLYCGCDKSSQDAAIAIARPQPVRFEEIAFPSDTTINDLAILNNGHIWAVGYNGKDPNEMYYSKDGGRSWIPMSVDSRGMILKALYFLDNQHGWAVGDSGIILTTADGGMSWSKSPTPTDYPLTRVHFVNTQVGYVVNGTEWGGEVFRTINSGEKWEKVYSDLEAGHVFDISVLDTKIAAIAINDALALTTRDGGGGWRKAGYKFAGAASVFYTVNGKLWIAGRNGGLYKSDDFGETWKTPSYISDDVKGADWISIAFDGERDGIVVGRNGAIAITNDAGQSWSSVDVGNKGNFGIVGFRRGIALVIGSEKAYVALR
jgi:photosystem II stability/assembly factor-like uncharacterized protein